MLLFANRAPSNPPKNKEKSSLLNFGSRTTRTRSPVLDLAHAKPARQSAEYVNDLKDTIAAVYTARRVARWWCGRDVYC